MLSANKITWLALVVIVAGWAAWPYLWEAAFYHFIAVGLALLFFALYRNGVAGKIGFWLAIGNLIDELFFDPTQVGIYEIIFALIVIIFTLWQAHRKSKHFGRK